MDSVIVRPEVVLCISVPNVPGQQQVPYPNAESAKVAVEHALETGVYKHDVEGQPLLVIQLCPGVVFFVIAKLDFQMRMAQHQIGTHQMPALSGR